MDTSVKRLYFPFRGNTERKIARKASEGYALVGVGVGFFCQLLVFQRPSTVTVETAAPAASTHA